MSIGSTVRAMFGPLEPLVSDLYRSLFFNADAFVRTVQRWAPAPSRILEVGCGEGAITQRLESAYPAATIMGIDITARLGRLYRGPADRVRFIETTVQELAAQAPTGFDLIVLADVLHHVPDAIRQELLDAIRSLLALGGQFVFKEWERNGTPIFWLGYAADRWITGDTVRFMTRSEIRERIATSFGAEAVQNEQRIAPWRSNLATLVRP